MKPKPFQRAAMLAGVIAGLLGLATAFGWIADVPMLRSFVRGHSEIKFNTALALVAAGAALILVTSAQRRQRKAGQALALFLVLLGVATLAEYAFSVSLGIDELLFKDVPGALGTTHPGRMSPQTTITFICIGLALFWLRWETRNGQRPAQWLALASAVFPLQLLIHHIYGGHVVMAIGSAQHSLMALPTILAMLAVSAGTLLAEPKAGWMTFATSRSFAGQSLRRMLVLALILPTAMGGLILFALGGRSNSPAYAVSAFAMMGTLAFGALMAQHTRRLHKAEVERDGAAAERERALKELQRAHQLLNDHAEQLEGLVRERTAALTEANQQLETFTFSIAHDLRAPIRAQHGFAQALQQDCGDQLSDEGRQYLQRILQSADKMRRMIEELLAYARMGNDQRDLSPLPLAPLLRAATEDLAADLAAKGGTLDVAPTDEVVVAHGATLSLCIANLVTNAIKFQRPGVPPRIRVWTESRADVVCLLVRDNGIGIPAAHREKIFGIFQRLHPASAYPGDGIGLALVRRGMERMQGRVTFESVENEGSTFCLELHRAGNPKASEAFADPTSRKSPATR